MACQDAGSGLGSGSTHSDAEVTEQDAFDCCACRTFAQLVASRYGTQCRKDFQSMLVLAEDIWWSQTPISGWLEAFAAHPRIGDMEELRARFSSSGAMSREEQATAAAETDDEVLRDLAELNQLYYEKFRHIFIICATGKSAVFMRGELEWRCQNSPNEELMTAAAEQMKITEIRLRRLFVSRGWPLEHSDAAAPSAAASRAGVRAGLLHSHLAPRRRRVRAQAAAARSLPAVAPPERPPITTHVLDMAAGRPAARVEVQLHVHAPGSGMLEPGTGDGAVWELLAASETGTDGRCTDLLPAGCYVEGVYRLTFQTAQYQASATASGAQAPTGLEERLYRAEPFFPQASVVFKAERGEHYHVPLTWSPFGYSTYRGS